MAGMTPEQWNRAVALFNEARRATTTAERDRILVARAEGDVLVALEVRAMLEADQAATASVREPKSVGDSGSRHEDDSSLIAFGGGGGGGPAASIAPNRLTEGTEAEPEDGTAGVALTRDDQPADARAVSPLVLALEAGAGITLVQEAVQAALERGRPRAAVDSAGEDEEGALESGAVGNPGAARTSAYDEELDDRLPPGTKVGPFTIVRLIDAGGMGIVYEAKQAKPARSVALKVMRLGLPSRSSMRRFEYESEILAHLQHSNIAQVFEAGMHFEASIRAGGQGIPYFAMEYIPDALPITAYADQHDLSTRERVELFLQVCDAVQHGHQKGIIHRDLKPSNILVDATGRVKVIDFGVAKATESDIAATTIATSVGQLIGTVQYMSPEQCSGEWGAVDTRSDVYSLGVILYELLCRVPPYEVSTTSILKATKAVCEAEVTTPSAANRELRGDIEAVVLCAINRNPAQRYTSGGEMGDDLRRWRDGDPVEAKTLGRWDRMTRWMRRHPIAVTGWICGLIVLTSALTSGLSTWHYTRRPADLWTSGSSVASVVELRSANGTVLHKWNGAQSAALVHRKDSGSARSIALSWGASAEAHRAMRVEFFSFARHPRSLAMPPLPVRSSNWAADWSDAHGYDPRRDAYHPSLSSPAVADIFPEVPGEEVVAFWRHTPGFACRLSIYSADGVEIYHRWHRGFLLDTCWIPETRQLIICGTRNDRWAEVPAGLRGEPRPAQVQVVLSLRPELDAGHDDLLVWRDGRKQVGVEWYCYLSPGNVRGHFDQWDLALHRSAGGENYVSLRAQDSHRSAGGRMFGVTFYFDAATGAVVRAVGGDPYLEVEGTTDEATGLHVVHVDEMQFRAFPRGLTHLSHGPDERWRITDPQPAVDFGELK